MFKSNITMLTIVKSGTDFEQQQKSYGMEFYQVICFILMATVKGNISIFPSQNSKLLLHDFWENS